MEGMLAGLGLAGFWVITLASFAGLFVLARRGLALWARVLIALFAGGLLGYLFGEVAGTAEPIGNAFIALIRMLVVPLVFVTITAGIVAMGDPKRIGSLGARTIVLYLCTTTVAVVLGIGAGLLIQPGAGVPYETADVGSQAEIRDRLETAGASQRGVTEQLLDVIPTNVVGAFANGNADILPVIFFAILFGIGIIASGQKDGDVGEGRLGQGMEALADAIIALTNIVMDLAPYGVFALMAWVLGTKGLGVLDNLALLALALYGACLVQMALVYGGLIGLVARLPVTRFFGGIVDAMSTAYSTASSSATLPVTIQNVTKLGVGKPVAGSVLPLGATINMDGTSIYLGIVAVFAAQAIGIDLGPAEYVGIAITAVAASVGAAGIPSASLFLAAAVLATFGVTEEQAVLVIALIFPFDRLLDMMRTVTNVTGDAAVATVVGKWEGELDEAVFRGERSASVAKVPA